MKTPSSPFPEKNRQQFISSPYRLNTTTETAEPFYQLLDLFANKVVVEGQYRFYEIINDFRSSFLSFDHDFKQSADENLLDILLLGTLWNEYKGRWGSSWIMLKEKLLKQLFVWRQNNPGIKSQVDVLRGKLGKWLLDKPTLEHTKITHQNFKLLVLWLSATGEFSLEVKSMNAWIRFLETRPADEVNNFLNEAVWFANWFKNESKNTLKKYTSGVDSFLKSHKQEYRGNENYFFTGRTEVEYHLNMVGASIMNKSMRNEFLETDHQVLLLPSCMVKNQNCKAVETSNGTVCQHCTKTCPISMASKEMEERGVQTYIIQHSSGFSTYLKRWANQKNTGLIGTACTLNLIAGGYEMKRMNIPAQCIFLDYCGCKKHWNKTGIPTNICLPRVNEIVNINRSKAV